jgi:hypothetical protein
MSFPKVYGIGRVADNEKAIVLYFKRPLTDDEMRVLHEDVRLLEHEVLGIWTDKELQ